MQNRFPFGGKCMALGLQNCQHRLKAVGLGGSTEKAAGKEHQDIPLTGRQNRQVGASYLHRGENGMVVRYLAVINNSFQLRRRGTVLAKRHILPQPQGQRANRCLHIRCDILAVCSWIGRQLFLIQALQIVKGLLGSKAIQAVALPL